MDNVYDTGLKDETERKMALDYRPDITSIQKIIKNYYHLHGPQQRRSIMYAQSLMRKILSSTPLKSTVISMFLNLKEELA